MPTILDSFIISIGLDPSAYVKGQKDASAAIEKTKKDAQAGAKEMEYRGKQAAEFFGELRKSVIELFAAFKLGQGFKDFIRDITQGGAQVGYLSKSLGISAKDLGTWQGAVEETGGTAEDATGTLQNLTKQLQEVKTTGTTGTLQYWRLLHISLRDGNDNLKTSTQLIMELTKAIQDQHIDPATATNILQHLGFTQGMINLVLQGTDAVKGFVAEAAKYAETAEQAKAAQELSRSYTLLDQALTAVGRDIWSNFEPAVTSVLDWVRAWIDANRQMIEQKADQYIHTALDYLKQLWIYLSTQVDWTAIIQDVKDFFKSVKDLGSEFFNARSAAQESFKDIKEAIGTVNDAILFLTSNINVIIDLLHGDFKKAWEDAGKGGKAAVDALGKSAPTQAPGGQGPANLTPVPGAQGRSRWQDLMYLFGFGGNSGTTVEVPIPGVHKESYYPGGGGGGGLENYIRKAAIARGIDPAVALQVVAGEGGFHGKVGDQGTSFGPFQLHYGGIAGGALGKAGLGDEFTKQTGLDARDPRNANATVDFALDHAKKHGWGSWYGFKGMPYSGIGAPQDLAMGGRAASMMANNQTSNTTNNNQRAQTHITVNVTTAATDAGGLVRDIDQALRNANFGGHANYSQA